MQSLIFEDATVISDGIIENDFCANILNRVHLQKTMKILPSASAEARARVWFLMCLKRFHYCFIVVLMLAFSAEKIA